MRTTHRESRSKTQRDTKRAIEKRGHRTICAKSYASAGRPTRRLHRVGQLSFAARHRGDGVAPKAVITRSAISAWVRPLLGDPSLRWPADPILGASGDSSLPATVNKRYLSTIVDEPVNVGLNKTGARTP